MGKGRPRSVEKGGLGQNSSLGLTNSICIPPAPVYYPTEDEFKDPLEFIYKIRPEAERFGICKIVPPKSWKPPFALDLDRFTFPTKAQAIHRLQVRPASCDSKTFELEYNRFLEGSGVKKAKKRVVFEGEDLDLCKLFNAVKRFGGYDRVVKEKKWGEVSKFVRSVRKISECAKHVLCQLYREHLYDYESYYSELNREGGKSCGSDERKCEEVDVLSAKRRGKNQGEERVELVKVEEGEHDQICEQCRSGLHGEVMLLCDRCNKGWHMYCLSPPLKQIPAGNWYCFDCLNSEKDCFGFVPGRQVSLEAFRRIADKAKRRWFGSGSTSRIQLEKKFWEIVEGSAGPLEVKYGSDLDTSVYGSGFPRISDQKPQAVEAAKWDEYCASPWNLNNLPKLQGSMLRAVHHSIAGVMVPWLYIGMLFSSFCWHFEDHCFYSMNYHHWGEPKCWYSVPGSEAGAFEKVMRNSLPDLFDAQPDLLFQLVTMLNPSVLQNSNVPVYSVLQEPGNFVITFPRSYHGGFNCGLNCAEAVNFAPADWLPHGGTGAELYQLYRKAPVLSHEELLCVVAKTDFDSKVTPYLIKELFRIYNKEKTWRAKLWRNGIVRSSSMSPREQPQYVGVEEDPTCIICQQLLYLSAVACRCRPSTFACLEHWKHLCECKANKHRLFYRHSLAELKDLMLNAAGKGDYEATLDENLQQQQPCSLDIGTLSKKVGGVHVTLVQLAEDWLLRSCKLLEMPYSIVAFANALKEAEQFLWGGSEMDSVREATRNLVEAQNWVEGVRDCVDKVVSWSGHSNHDMDKVHIIHVRKLLSIDPVPFNEPEFFKLKDFAEEAELLIQEIRSALSLGPQVSIVDWEILHTKACDLGIFVEESQKLSDKLSFVKIWVDNVRKCIAEKSSAAIEVDTLEKLKSEVSELQIQLPEIEMLGNLMRQVESCQSRCNKILDGSINLKQLKLFLEEMDGFTVNVPELKLLRQYQNDAVSWISRFNDAVQNSQQCNDQENVVNELTCIMKDGALLKIRVDELSHAEAELKKAQCRLNGLKARQCKVPLDVFKEILVEASRLQIGHEKLFINLSGVLAVALSWEERANHILSSESHISDFEDLIRTSEGISILLPSLENVKEAVSAARSWLNKSKPFLCSGISMIPASDGLLRFETLKELVAKSELLKICLIEKSLLQKILDNCIQWELQACSVLDSTEGLLQINDIEDSGSTGLTTTIERQIDSLESVVKTGPCLQFEFVVTQKLHDACAVLRWCLKSLSFRDITPEIEEVLMLLEVASHLPTTYASCKLWSLLVGGVNWLKNALEIFLPCNRRKFKLSYVEEVLWKSQIINVSFPVIASQLQNAIKKHNLWLEQVQHFVSVKSGHRSSFLLFQLKEFGSTDAFNCSELEMVVSEVERVEKWRHSCENIAGLVGEVEQLPDALAELNNTLDRSLQIYDNFTGCKQEQLCVRCFCELKDQKLLTCSFCNKCYHFRCIEPTGHGDPNNCIKCICPYCDFIKRGNIARSGGGFLKNRKQRPSLNELTQMLSNAELLCVWVEERDLLCQIVEKAKLCRTRLTEVADFVLAHVDKDLNMVGEKLSTALKAVEVAGVYDHDSNCKFDLAIARNSWRVRAQKLLEPSLKPTVQQIQRHLKEGSAISIPLGDYFKEKLMEVKYQCVQWVDKAKKVSVDSGELELDKVYDLIMEGNNMFVDVEKELKLLQDRSMLYCICRKPYDQRAMIACDKCDEWYHFDCIKLTSPPKVYACPACKLDIDYLSSSPSSSEERSTNKCEEPQTPSPGRPDSRRTKQPESLCRKRNKPDSTENSNMSRLTGFGNLLWRNRKPFRRVARKREELDILSPLFHVQQ
ncbi:Lysine-specific demethylase rbr-2 [Heracleum sosnowskyi]|uniref:Lysine-specific demethylase rbr-2 n=1 Tax=Heracleum sosnowskyi TaxID=360622 RepID=A0AAD8HVS4_9APIA|nr:Lysine-specific demethylase rbr-2 [Heracleum sosnowskyi]